MKWTRSRYDLIRLYLDQDKPFIDIFNITKNIPISSFAIMHIDDIRETISSDLTFDQRYRLVSRTEDHFWPEETTSSSGTLPV